MKLGNSKYAIVVAVAKRARVLSEKYREDENYRLSSMVTVALDEIERGDIKIQKEKEIMET